MNRLFPVFILLLICFAEVSVLLSGQALSGGWPADVDRVEQPWISKFPLIITDTESPVASIKILTENGGRVAWSQSNNLIAFDRRGADGFYDIYTMTPDGTEEKCITCKNLKLPGKHTGNPAWHPSGEYIIFQAQKRFQIFNSYWSAPGRGFNNDLWLITTDGKKTYKLRSLKHRMGLLHPHFSHDGSRVFWSEKIGEKRWALKVADFFIDKAGPDLSNIETYTPGAGLFYESHGFSRDGSKILFSGNLEGQAMTGIDIYTLNIETQELENLTSSFDQWDEHAHFSPGGKKIVWMSSKAYNWDAEQIRELRTDLWMMDVDGSDKTQLTFFNEPESLEYTGERIVVADMAWSPDGISLVAYLILPSDDSAEVTGKIALITFREPQ